jgi:hypothetical protein
MPMFSLVYIKNDLLALKFTKICIEAKYDYHTNETAPPPIQLR